MSRVQYLIGKSVMPGGDSVVKLTRSAGVEQRTVEILKWNVVSINSRVGIVTAGRVYAEKSSLC